MSKALQGIRVLDLTNVLAGPLCAYQLALLGADVIKVETPRTGDLARQLGGDDELNAGLMGASFLAQNAGKKSVTVNLKSPQGRAVLMRLVDSADVLIENFRPGVMARLGLGHEVLRARKPSLVYCAISGFGQEGPLKDVPAYDQIIQGLSGMMSVTGDEQCAPLRAGYPVADTVSGVIAAFAITSALVRRYRADEGAFIDVSMLDSAVVSMGWIVSNHLIGGIDPMPHGNSNFTAAPSGTFRTQAGLLNISANKHEQFERLAHAIGRPELIDDPRFATRAARKRNRSALTDELESSLRAKTAIQWEELLVKAGVPAGRIATVPEALRSAQIASRGLLQTIDKVPGLARPIVVAGTGFKLSAGDPVADRPPPRLGEHTEAVLESLGYTPDEIRTMRAEGVV